MKARSGKHPTERDTRTAWVSGLDVRFIMPLVPQQRESESPKKGSDPQPEGSRKPQTGRPVLTLTRQRTHMKGEGDVHSPPQKTRSRPADTRAASGAVRHPRLSPQPLQWPCGGLAALPRTTALTGRSGEARQGSHGISAQVRAVLGAGPPQVLAPQPAPAPPHTTGPHLPSIFSIIFQREGRTD